jgi:hypothetical protein
LKPGSPLVAPPSSGLMSHYHPFDPSTKWLPQGTLAIRLIIRPLWPFRHGALGSAAADGP